MAQLVPTRELVRSYQTCLSSILPWCGVLHVVLVGLVLLCVTGAPARAENLLLAGIGQGATARDLLSNPSEVNCRWCFESTVKGEWEYRVPSGQLVGFHGDICRRYCA